MFKSVNAIVGLISFLAFSYPTFVHSTSEKEFPVIEILHGNVNGTNTGIINYELQKIFYYNLKETLQDYSEANVRISVSVSPFLRDCPILFSVREARAVLSWQLPIIQPDKAGHSVYYYTAERSLCTELKNNELEQNLQIEISTCSVEPIEFTVSLLVLNDIVIRLDDASKEVEVSPVAPVYFRFEFDPSPNADSVLVTVQDPVCMDPQDVQDGTCLIFSIQQPHCPIMDQEFNIQFRGYWQSMTTLGSILLRRRQYPDGFFIVLVALTDETRCVKESSIFESASRSVGPPNALRTKKVSIAVEGVIEPEDYVTPVLMPLVFIFGLILLIFIVFSIFQNALQRLKEQGAHISFITDFTPGKTPFQSCLCLEELKETNVQTLQRKSDRYYWSILTIGIFYCVPVIQLISNYLKVLYRTGDYDLCYYNYRCARPLGYVMDFNHIYSNIGYVLFGITFLLFVNFRQRSLHVEQFHPSAEQPFPLDLNSNPGDGDPTFDNNGIIRKILPRILGNASSQHGTLQNYGLYYALGIALILEGVLSAAYHICPNESNFQFDTSFMYVIAVLGIVKVYQFRHPVYLSANITFIGLAFIAASSVFGLLFNNLIFKICFSVFYFFGMTTLLIYLYHIGFAVDGNGVLITSWVEIYKGIFRITTTYERSKSVNSTFGRILLPLLAVTLNSMLIIFLWTIMIENNFATQLLAIFVANFSMYTLYYAIMKLVHGEYKSKLWIQLLIYGSLSVALWVLSLNYFIQVQSSWEDSPAESRELNEDCVVYSFYDNHDLWHFASSGALLTSFMVLLTIDDDLITTKHENIPVF